MSDDLLHGGHGAGCGCGPSATPTGPQADASVRTGRPSDAPAVGLVQATVWQTEYAGILSQEVLDALTGPRFASVWRRSLEAPPTPRHRLLVACAGPQVVGYVAVGPAGDEPGLPRGTAMIYDGGVHPDARTSGHGSRLLNAAVDTLMAGATEETGPVTAVATWVLADAEGTRAFLQGAGLEPDGAWRDRIVDEDGSTAREVRLIVAVGEQPEEAPADPTASPDQTDPGMPQASGDPTASPAQDR